MSTKTSACPQKGKLVEYLLGKLSADELANCESHIADCPACEDTIRGLEARDTLADLAGAAMAIAPQAVDPRDEQLINDLIWQFSNQPTAPGDHGQDELLADRAAEVNRFFEVVGDGQSIGQLAHYRILETIGAGSTGVVYRAFDQQLEREVALKILRPSLGPAARQRFMAEARAAAAIDHPNVITIYQVGIKGPLAFLSMQWLPGQTLDNYLSSIPYLAEEQTRQIGLQIASGLAAAHAKNLIHRDIKPANIWMPSESEQIKILDFGLARIADDDPQMTSTGMLAGTPNFMSPEQTRGAELDGRSDLFSLGCLLYRAATGKLPFCAAGILATLQSIQNDQPAAPQKFNPQLSKDLAAIILCLLEKQPPDRPASAADLITALTGPRSEWPFAVPSRSVQPAAKQAAAHPKQTRSKPKLWQWAVAAMLLGLIGWGAYGFGQQIIRIATNQGELLIEPLDDDVEIKILNRGQLVQLIDTATQESIDLKAGEYQLQIQGSGQHSYTLSPSDFVISRGGKQIVRVRRLETKPVVEELAVLGAVTANVAREKIAEFLALRRQLDMDQQSLDPQHPKIVVALEQTKNIRQDLLKLGIDMDQIQILSGGGRAGTVDVDVSDRQTADDKMPLREQLISKKLLILQSDYDRKLKLFNRGSISESELRQAELELIDEQLRLIDEMDVPVPASPAQLPADQPTYKGKTLVQWRKLLKTERSRQTIRDAIKGMAELTIGNRPAQEKMLAAITPLIRQHGSGVIGLDDGLDEAFIDMFSYLEPARVIEFAVAEIREGTAASRKFLVWLLTPGSCYQGDQENQSQHRAVLETNATRLTAEMLKPILMNSGDTEEKIQAANLLAYLVSTLMRDEDQWQKNKTPEELAATHGDVIQALQSAFGTLENRELIAHLGSQLVRIAPSTPQLASKLAVAMNDGAIRPLYNGFAFEALMELDPAYADDALPAMIQLWDNEPQFDQVDTVLPGQLGRQDTRKTILAFIEKCGPAAHSALPWLEELAEKDQEYRSQVLKVIESIQGHENQK